MSVGIKGVVTGVLLAVARIAGETKYPISKMLKFASTAMLYFSKKPLRLATRGRLAAG